MRRRALMVSGVFVLVFALAVLHNIRQTDEAVRYAPKEETVSREETVYQGERTQQTGEQPISQTGVSQEEIVPPTFVEVTLQGFVPATVEVPLRGTVLWNNTINRPVIIQDYEGTFQAKLGFGESYNFTFEKEGEYPYRDLIHNWRGTIVVKPEYIVLLR